MLLFVICFLIDWFEGNNKSISSSDEFNRLSEYLNPSVVIKAQALKEPKDKLCFKESNW